MIPGLTRLLSGLRFFSFHSGLLLVQFSFKSRSSYPFHITLFDLLCLHLSLRTTLNRCFQTLRISTHDPSIGMPPVGCCVLGNCVDRWRIVLWDKAFLPFFTSKDLKFFKGSNLPTFEGGPMSIKRVLYRFACYYHIFLHYHGLFFFSCTI